jgi:hypothetical protein
MKTTKTKHEKLYMSKIADLGCIICSKMGFPNSPAELHHIKDKTGMGRKASNFEIIPLCPRHHRQGKDSYSVTEFLPVLDYKNKPIANPNCFDVNSAYQRCLVKCMAYMGLGMYIYQGETINQNAPLQFEVKSVSGESEKTEDLSGLKEVMLKFMVGPDGTTTLNNLRQFWAINKTPLEQMERLDPESYKSVYDAFMKKAEELKEKTA